MNKNELPDGWKLEKISRVVDDSLSGFACAISSLVEKGGYIQLRPFNIEDGKLNLETLYQVPRDVVDTNLYCLKKGDILFNNTNSTELVGKSALVDRDYPFAFSNHINRIRVKISLLMPEYFYYYLYYMWSKNHFAKYCKKWIGQSGYTLNELNEQIILLPPISEQEKIVSKLNEQMAQIEIMKKEAEKQSKYSEFFFQSSLTKIFSRYEKDIDWITLKEATEKISKGSTPTTYGHNYVTKGIPFIRAEDVVGSKVDIGKVKFYISEETHDFLKRSQLAEGDVLITIAGTLGRVGYLSKLENGGNCNQAVCFLRPKKEFKTKFILYSLQSQYILSKILGSKVGGGIPNLNMGNISKIKIPLLSVEEQEIFINNVDSELKKLNFVILNINSQLEAINQLPNSILNEVFDKYEIPDEA